MVFNCLSLEIYNWLKIGYDILPNRFGESAYRSSTAKGISNSNTSA
jgi:hypothetical protein